MRVFNAPWFSMRVKQRVETARAVRFYSEEVIISVPFILCYFSFFFGFLLAQPFCLLCARSTYSNKLILYVNESSDECGDKIIRGAPMARIAYRSTSKWFKHTIIHVNELIAPLGSRETRFGNHFFAWKTVWTGPLRRWSKSRFYKCIETTNRFRIALHCGLLRCATTISTCAQSTVNRQNWHEGNALVQNRVFIHFILLIVISFQMLLCIQIERALHNA